ncbi:MULTISPECIES: hypothetical protein [unclassified Microcoleus]|uniref:hypothetical protein n=1 Tax=unclassified Microcoleus TaxID=2642155 RepID=UPI002FD71505
MSSASQAIADCAVLAADLAYNYEEVLELQDRDRLFTYIYRKSLKKVKPQTFGIL